MKNFFSKRTYTIIVIIQIILLLLLKNTITNIYYTGFQNKGFNSQILDIISAKTYDKYSLLMSSKDREFMDSTYKYNENKDCYYLKEEYDKTNLNEITKEVLPLHYLFYEGLQKGYDEVLSLEEYKNIYNVLENLSDKQRTKLLKEPKNQLSKYRDREISELIIKDIQVEYKRLGKDINKIKNNYINKSYIVLAIELLLLILLSTINILNIKKNNLSYRTVELTQSVILLIITFISLFKVKTLLTSILLIIYLLILGSIKLLENLRRKNKSYNIELSKLEDLIDTDKHIEKNYKTKWIILPIILFIINLIIYNRYTTYHIFTGLEPYKFQILLLYWFILIINIFTFRSLFFYRLEDMKGNRPIIKKEKNIVRETVNKEPKKKKKKKKKSKK